MFAHIPNGMIERALLYLGGIAFLVVLGVAGLVWLIVKLARGKNAKR